MTDFRIHAVACIDLDWGLGCKGELPWLQDGISDLEWVRWLTTRNEPGKRNILIVGRKTFEGLPERMRMDESREFFVLGHGIPDSRVVFFDSPESVYRACLERWHVAKDVSAFFVFGGGEVYRIFLQRGWIHTFYLTQIHKQYECDVHLDKDSFLGTMRLVRSTPVDSKGRQSHEYQNRDLEHPEREYLKLLEHVYYQGERRDTRNGRTRSSFGASLSFDIRRWGFPLLTTKRMFWRGIVEELLWFLRGDTDARNLAERGVHIWDGNSSREFLNRMGLHHYREGLCGPIYGWQWTNWNGEYLEHSSERPAHYTPKRGIDQIQECIRQIREEPTSRRILFSGWNPEQLGQMALPPCHVLYQFYVEADGALSCHMYQRSADLFLGLPFNIASTALLTTLIAHITEKSVGSVRISIGDAHIYEEHEAAILEQIVRSPKGFPSVRIGGDTKQYNEYTADDIQLVDYGSFGALRSVMKA